MRSMLAILLLLAVSSPVLAADGVNEINQTCAASTGCFTGDSAGFPVTIGSAPGRSYRLTGDLVVPDGNTTAIKIVADGVTVDLGGFEIRGPNHCVNGVCLLDGTGFGFELTGDRTRIMNGSITGMGSVGIYANFLSGHLVENVRVAHNRYQGIRLDGYGNTIRGVIANENGDDGIRISGFGPSVVDCMVYGNAGNGMTLFAGGCKVLGNSVVGNFHDGIRVGQGCTIQANTVRTNAGIGLVTGSESSFRENTISDNAGGTVESAGINNGNNVCNGSQTCP